MRAADLCLLGEPRFDEERVFRGWVVRRWMDGALRGRPLKAWITPGSLGN